LLHLSVDPPDLRDDLLEFLQASSCLAVKRGAAEIDTQLLNSVSERHDRAVLIGTSSRGKRNTVVLASKSSPISSVDPAGEAGRWANGSLASPALAR